MNPLVDARLGPRKWTAKMERDHRRRACRSLSRRPKCPLLAKAGDGSHDVADSRRPVMDNLKHAPRGTKWRPKARDRAGSIAHCLYEGGSRDRQSTRALSCCQGKKSPGCGATSRAESALGFGTESQRRAMSVMGVTKRADEEMNCSKEREL